MVTTAASQPTIPIKVSFSGGLEILFSMHRNLNIHLPSSPPPTANTLISHLLTLSEFDTSRKDLFVMDGTVRPGILVLINDADWELEGEGEYEVKAGDEVVFVSTLHGG